jgi:DNA-binding NarL/FixJ family response regulator
VWGIAHFRHTSAIRLTQVTAIRRVLEGHVYVAKAIAQSLNKASEARPKSGDRTTDWLTNRQREVLQLLAEGRQLKEIAATLTVSRRTVEFHKYRIMDILGFARSLDWPAML